jgi:hypothetical protein
MIRWDASSNYAFPTLGDEKRWQTRNQHGIQDSQEVKEAKSFCNRMAHYLAKAVSLSGSRGLQEVLSSSNIESMAWCMLQDMHMDVQLLLSWNDFNEKWRHAGVSKDVLLLVYNLLHT